VLCSQAQMHKMSVGMESNGRDHGGSLGHRAQLSFCISDSEQLFSSAGQVYADRRSNLTGKNAEKLLFLAYNIRLFGFRYRHLTAIM